LDDFLKSTFMDMFGDPVRNEKEPKRKLGDYISFITSGSRGWAKYYSDEGDVFLRINNIRYGYFKLDDLKYVNAPNNAEAKRTKIETNDLLISITADLGRTAVVTEQLNGSFINQHLALIRLKKEDINPLYLAWYFAMPFGRSVVLRKNRNAVKAGLNFDDIKAFDIVVPPLDIQNHFVAVVT
jgi:type I restriction enzyme S subunit